MRRRSIIIFLGAELHDYEWLKKVYDPNAERILRTGAIENDDLGTRKSLQVSKHGPPVTAYLMEIPEETVREGQLTKELAIQETESSIRNASDGIGQSRDSAGQSVVDNPSKSGNQLME